MTYTPTVYEQIVQDFFAGKKLNFEDYKESLAERGWGEKRYFDAYVQDIKYIRELMQRMDFKSVAMNYVKASLRGDEKASSIAKTELEQKGCDKKYYEYIDQISELLKGIKNQEGALKFLENKSDVNALENTEDKNLIQQIDAIIYENGLDLRKAADMVKQNHPSKDEDVLRFSLTEKEKQIVLDAEELGAVKDGEIIKYDGYDKEIVCANYKKLPSNTDAFVIFSGHPGAAEPAIEAWLADIKNTGTPKKLIFLGLYDNQGNTDFSQEGLQYNTGSEVEMYVRYCRSAGISEEILQECLVTPNDTSTEDNTQLLAEIRNKYFKDKEDVSFVMFGYPSYQKRIASEFSFAFNKMEKDGDVKSTHFVMPAVPVSRDEHNRYLSYDNLDGIAQDIIIGNCVAHPYRVSAGGRFDSKLGEYPEEFKPLLPVSLVYSYPNVAKELAGTDEKIGTMLKLLRAVQHEVYQFENPRRVDNTIKRNLIQVTKNLALDGLMSADDVFHGNELRAKEAIQRIKKHQSSANEDVNAIEAARVLLGEHTRPEKLGPVAEYLKNWKASQGRKN